MANNPGVAAGGIDLTWNTSNATAVPAMQGPIRDMETTYVVIAMLSFLSVMGTAGNAVVLYVFSQKKDKLVSTLFIIVLALVDFVTCLVVMPYTIYLEYTNYIIDYDILCKLYQFLITSNIPFSALIMVAIAVDRYFCICHPFLHALNVTRAKITIACLGLFATGLGVTVGLMYGVYHKFNADEVYNVTGYSLDNGSMERIRPEDVAEQGFNITAPGYLIDSTNVTGKGVTNSSSNSTPIREVVLFTGECDVNGLVLSKGFVWYYQKFYTAMYFICLIIVIVLYVAIYRSVLARRSKRQKQKSKSLQLVVSMGTERTCDNTVEETLLTSANGDTTATPDKSDSAAVAMASVAAKNGKGNAGNSGGGRSNRRKSTKKDNQRMANLKTAAMLFVVTVVFIVTFLPAFLMAVELIPGNDIVFNMYFANNVANPVIYSFMNKNFRDDLKRLFCRR